MSLKKRPYSSVCKFMSNTAGQRPTHSDGTSAFFAVGQRDAVVANAISGDARRIKGALLANAYIRHGAAGRLISEMFLVRRDGLLFKQNFVGAAHGDHGFLHAVFHPFDDGGHADEAGHAENDAEHGQHRTELVRPDLLEPNQDGVDQGSFVTQRLDRIELRAALIAGNKPGQDADAHAGAEGERAWPER